MKVLKFEDLIAWQKAQDLAVNVYTLFENLKDWNFKNQISSAGVSISNNIAEGFDRQSNKEFSRFLYIALGSNSEVKSMLYLAKRLNYLNKSNTDILIEQSREIAKIIRGLIKSLQPPN